MDFHCFEFYTSKLLILCRFVRYPLFQFVHFTYSIQMSFEIRGFRSISGLIFKIFIFKPEFLNDPLVYSLFSES